MTVALHASEKVMPNLARVRVEGGWLYVSDAGVMAFVPDGPVVPAEAPAAATDAALAGAIGEVEQFLEAQRLSGQCDALSHAVKEVENVVFQLGVELEQIGAAKASLAARPAVLRRLRELCLSLTEELIVARNKLAAIQNPTL